MSVEEGLKSTDVEVVKQARGVAKSRVTKFIKTLKLLLICNSTGIFLIDEIDAEKVEENYSKLEKNFDDFLELHERCLVFQSGAINIDPNYADEVSNLFSKITRDYNKYKKVLKNRSKEEYISGLRDQVNALKSTLEAKGSAAKYIIDSEDINVQKTASLSKEELRSALSNYTTKAEEYKRAISDDNEQKYTPAEDYSEVTKQVEEMCVQLQSFSLKYPICESKSGITDRSEEIPGSCIVKLQKLTCPKFSGIPRDFGQFKRDFNQIVNVPGRPDVEIGMNLREAVPDKYKHYINHLDTSNHTKMMSILENKFGTRTLVVRDITSELEKFRMVTTDKSFVEFVEKLEKIKLDLETLDQLDEIGNAGYIGLIESKLPVSISTDWFKIVIGENLNNSSSIDRYRRLMVFLTNAKDRVECQMSINYDGSSSGSVKSFTNCANTIFSKCSGQNNGDLKRHWNPCLACNVDDTIDVRSTCHPMDTCKVWRNLPYSDKENLVMCVKHPFKRNHATSECTVKSKKCKYCFKEDHHFLLCPAKQVDSISNIVNVHANAISCDQSKPPVLLQAQFVYGPGGNKIGTLLDLCSTDDYVTHNYAKKHQLHGHQVELLVGGIGDKTTNISTIVYMVPIMVEGKVYEFPCYDLDSITSRILPPNMESYSDLCSVFKVRSSQVKRPTSIDLLISMRQNFLHPRPMKTIDRMTLYNGPLGKVFGGVDPNLVFTPIDTYYPTSINLLTTSNQYHYMDQEPNVKSDFKPDNIADTDENFHNNVINNEEVSSETDLRAKMVFIWLIEPFLSIDRNFFMKLLFILFSFLLIVGRPARESSVREIKMEPSFPNYNRKLILSHASFQYIKWQMERKGAVDYTYTSELDEFRGEITNVIQISINLVRKVRILVEFQQHYIGSNNIKLDRHVFSSIVYEKLKWCVGDSSIIYQDLFIRKLKWQDRSFHHLQARLKGNSVQISILSARKSFLC